MNRVERTKAYLTLPHGEFHWSRTCDAIEDAEGHTVILFEQLVELLEGLFATPTIPPFVYVLNLFVLMKRGGAGSFQRLRHAYEQAIGSPALPRNCGAFIAAICQSLPDRIDAPTWDDLKKELGRRRRQGEHYRPELAVTPRLTDDEFRQAIHTILNRYDDETLIHWLRMAAPASIAGPNLAEPLASLPDRIRAILAKASNNPRLAGAAALVASIDAALTIPTRRRFAESVPQGGYADVTTRGDPDHLLLTQFALDSDEFVRRFAERELLYYRREDPHEAPKPERVIILDQGVRTWGVVRHALTAASLTLLRKDARRFGESRLVTEPTIFDSDLSKLSVDQLTAILESSDLTATPVRILSAALSSGGETPRDLILLTHPRALREPAMIQAMKSLRACDRLFVLSVDAEGEAELMEWASFGPKPIRSFRIDLESAEEATARLLPDIEPKNHSVLNRWSGDVEPIVFPFRPGTLASPEHLGFDANSDYLVYSDVHSALHALRLTGEKGPPEILPRAMYKGVVFRDYTQILPVRGGVVVCGTIDVPGAKSSLIIPLKESKQAVLKVPSKPETRYIAAHYDFSNHTVRIHDFGKKNENCTFVSNASDHTVICIHYEFEREAPYFLPNQSTSSAINLATGQQFFWLGTRDYPARQALHNAIKEFPQEDTIPVMETDVVNNNSGRPYLRQRSYLLAVCNGGQPWKSIDLRENGIAVLPGSKIHSATLNGNLLGILVEKEGQHNLHLIRGPEAIALRIIFNVKVKPLYRVSENSELIAFERKGVVLVEATNSPQTLANSYSAKLHFNLKFQYFQASPFLLVCQIGSHCAKFEEANGEFKYSYSRVLFHGKRAIYYGKLPNPFPYDVKRFPESMVKSDNLLAIFDQFGQIIITKANGDPVAYLILKRNRAAARLPDGTAWGDVSLLGCPASANASEKICDAIRTARGDLE